MSTSDRRPLLDDDRGAVMVMGIFMCSCLVGALWYLAGIGDAVMYRERMQEAADAIAFSDAALHARGMNLLVLINLVMAVILSLRVIIRVAKLTCTIAAAVFGALGLIEPGLFAAAAPAAAAAQTLDGIDNSMKTPIDTALQALTTTESVIAQTVPALAHVAVLATVGTEYGPFVKSPGAAYRANHSFPDTDTLPVEQGSPGKLCDKAGEAIGDITKFLLHKVGGAILDTVADVIQGMMEGLLSTDRSYFCDLEGGQSQPNTDSQYTEPAVKKCMSGNDLALQQRQQFDKAERDWEDQCAAVGVVCQGFDSKGAILAKGVQTGQARGSGPVDATKNQNLLDHFRLQRDENAESLDELAKNKIDNSPGGLGKCIQWAEGDMKRRQKDSDALNQKQGSTAGGTSQGESGVAPIRVNAEFHNGNKEGQFVGAVLGDETRLRADSKLVRIGAFNSKKTPAVQDPEGAKLPAWAQAEMYFDCGSHTWSDKECNDNEEAMWHFKWRPRLRRFNLKTDEMFQRLTLELGGTFTPPRRGPEDFAKQLEDDAEPQNMGFKTNGSLRKNLQTLVQDQTTQTQGVH